MSAPQNQSQEQTPALIYCRVSGKKQAIQGTGLDSQEHRCREYARHKGYAVEAVFPDDVSGGGNFMNRKGMVALLSYLDAQADKDYVIIFDDLKRLARDTIAHLKLRQELSLRGARPECLNFTFEDTPEGAFIETILAAQGELERKQNRRQTVQKTRAQLEQGYWVFHAPAGYAYKQTRHEGKILIRNEPLASIVQEALEGYAAGRFQSQAEVKRHLEAQPAFPKQLPGGKIRLQKVTDLLENPIYAGLVSCKRWGIPPLKGRHDPLITFTTFEKIQARIKGAAMAPARKNIGQDFALRGFATCASCGVPLYSAFSRSATGRQYAYYRCHTKGCDLAGKSIPRDALEGEFAALLKSLRPAAPLIAMAREMFFDAWDQRSKQAGDVLKSLKGDLRQIERQIDKLLDRIAESASPRAAQAYERKLDALEGERLSAEDKIERFTLESGSSGVQARKKLELALTFLANPWKIWEKGDSAMRRMVLRLVFLEPLEYCPKNGTRTPKTTLPFKVLGGFETSESGLVQQTGRI
ncbi:MAG: recombinase family protein [Pseudomonadota bacterium]